MKTNFLVNVLTKHKTKRYTTRSLDQIKYIVIHHFANDITIEGAAVYHVNGHGWSGIGYFAVIDLDGSVNITNYMDTKCYGVANNNTQCLSIALRGNWSELLPPKIMLQGLDDAIHMVWNILGPIQVKVHSDFVNTECPGEELRKYVRKTYPSPAPLTVPLSMFRIWWNKIWGLDRGH